jgi:hypothetical protein
MSQVFNFINTSRYRAACEQGSEFNSGVYLRDGCNNTPIDISNCTAIMQVRPTPDSATLIIEFSTLNGRITIDPLMGKITMTASSAVTELLVPGKYVYNLDLTFTVNNVTKRIIEGSFEVTAEVTHP